MHLRHYLLLVAAVVVRQCAGIGCLPQVCDGNVDNNLRTGVEDHFSGRYNGLRWYGRQVPGVDLTCATDRNIYAPFDGTVRGWRPFGYAKDFECLDKGITIVADEDSQWNGYTMRIAYVQPVKYNRVKKGDVIAKSIETNCGAPRWPSDAEAHVQIELLKSDEPIDPTFHLNDCLCTGRLCESNSLNRIIENRNHPEQPISLPTYGGVFGYELHCPKQRDKYGPNGKLIPSSQQKDRAPFIYAPFDASYIGRVRIHSSDRGYVGCDNDAIFMRGRGRFKDFTVHIYNAKVLHNTTLGERNIQQGAIIGTRLDCDNSPATIFVEFRYQENFPDMYKQIRASNCSLPTRFY